MSARRSRRAHDRALGWNRGLIWERSVGAQGRAEVASPSALALGGRHGRRCQAPVSWGRRSNEGVTARARDGTGNFFGRTLTSR